MPSTLPVTTLRTRRYKVGYFGNFMIFKNLQNNRTF